MRRYTIPRSVRLLLLYLGPSIYIEDDILRLVDESKTLAYRQGYKAATDQVTM